MATSAASTELSSSWSVTPPSIYEVYVFCPIMLFLFINQQISWCYSIDVKTFRFWVSWYQSQVDIHAIEHREVLHRNGGHESWSTYIIQPVLIVHLSPRHRTLILKLHSRIWQNCSYLCRPFFLVAWGICQQHTQDYLIDEIEHS